VIFACNADAISALDLRVGPIQKLEEALFSMSKATPRAKAARTPGGTLQKSVIGPCRERHRHSAQHVQGHSTELIISGRKAAVARDARQPAYSNS
jgi:hypothetical protein